MPELRKLVALMAVQLPFVNSPEDFAAIAESYLVQLEKEYQQRLRREKSKLKARVEMAVRRQIKRENEEAEMWLYDKAFSPPSIRKLISMCGY